jgi:hypothetical protein
MEKVLPLSIEILTSKTVDVCSIKVKRLLHNLIIFSYHIMNMQSPLTSKQLSTKMTTAYHIGNPGSGFRHAQKYGWV